MTEFTIRKADGNWVVRSGGAVLGETANALAVEQQGQDPVIYFPRADIATAFLDLSGKTQEDAGLGVATYYSIVNKSSVTENACWGYDAPSAEAEMLRDHLAFARHETLKVEQV